MLIFQILGLIFLSGVSLSPKDCIYFSHGSVQRLQTILVHTEPEFTKMIRHVCFHVWGDSVEGQGKHKSFCRWTEMFPLLVEKLVSPALRVSVTIISRKLPETKKETFEPGLVAHVCNTAPER